MKYRRRLTRSQDKKSRTGQRKARDPKEKIIASLREENKRLKELSTALVTMYDGAAKTTAAGKEGPQCHNLHATVKKLITRSFPLDCSDSVHLPNGDLESSNPYPYDVSGSGMEQSCSPAEMGLMQLSVQDRELSDIRAGLTGCFDQGAGQSSLTSPVVWDSHPDHPPTIGDLNSTTYPATEKTRHHQGAFGTTPYGMSQQSLRAPLLTTLPLPTSHAYLEPTFSRRLVRLLWEYAFNVLTASHIPPAQVNRCFGFCFRSRDKETLIKKFRAYLGLSADPVSALDRQVWNTAPDVRDARDGEGDDWEYWLEAGKIEMYLESLGFSLSGNDDQKDAILDFIPAFQHSPGKSGACSTSSSSSTGRDKMQAAPQVPYGSKWQPDSCITNSLFDDRGIFHVPASWLTPSAPGAAEPIDSQAHLNAERILRRGTGCYLDVNRFFAGLIEVSVCLGRAAGFKRMDVDGVLRRSLVKS